MGEQAMILDFSDSRKPKRTLVEKPDDRFPPGIGTEKPVVLPLTKGINARGTLAGNPIPGVPASNRPAGTSTVKPKHTVKPKAKASEETVKVWTERLRTRVKAAIAEGRKPHFASRQPVSRIRIRSIDEQGGMQVTIEPGLETAMKWSKLDAVEYRSLAESLAGEGAALEDHAVAAFFLYLEGKREQAYKQLGKAGAPGDEVEVIFTPSTGQNGVDHEAENRK